MALLTAAGAVAGAVEAMVGVVAGAVEAAVGAAAVEAPVEGLRFIAVQVTTHRHFVDDVEEITPNQGIY